MTWILLSLRHKNQSEIIVSHKIIVHFSFEKVTYLLRNEWECKNQLADI